MTKIKAFIGSHQQELYIATLLLLIALISFGLGRLSVIYGNNGGVKIEYPNGQSATAAQALSGTTGAYVASKTGSKYFPVSCSGAASINDTNKIYFTTKADAEARGYTAAANCKGL